MPGFCVGRPEDRRRMNGGQDAGRPRRFEPFPPLLSDPEIAAQEGLGCSCAQANQHLGFQQSQFSFEPGSAYRYFFGIRLLVDVLLAFGLPFEMLDHVGQVGFVPAYAGGFEGFVEQLARRTDKWLALDVFIETGLFPNENGLRMRGTKPEDRLRPVLPKRASPAISRRLAQAGDGFMTRGETCGVKRPGSSLGTDTPSLVFISNHCAESLRPGTIQQWGRERSPAPSHV